MSEQVTEDMDILHALNETELALIIRRQTGLVMKRSVGRDRMIQLLEEGGMPLPEEISPTTESRKKLQVFIEKNWVALNSQLPCKGENKGRCTVYPCPEGRHLDCLLAAGAQLKLHDL